MTDERDGMPEPAQSPAGEEPATAGLVNRSFDRPRPMPAKAALVKPPERAPVRQRSAGWVVTVSVLGAIVVVLAAALVAGVFALNHQRDSNARGRALSTAQAQALQVAAKYAVDFGSYNYETLDADFKKVTAELTPSFATNYAQVSAALKSTIEQYKGKSTATVQDIGVAKVNSPTSVVVLVFLDQSVTTTQSTAARIDRNRLEMTLEKQNGTWLISNLLLK